MRKLSIAQARRIAIRAQHLDRTKPAKTRADVANMVDRMGVLQIDNARRSRPAPHDPPLYSRFGPYDTSLLDEAGTKPPRLIHEQWGHEASFVPPRTHRLLAGFGEAMGVGLCTR